MVVTKAPSEPFEVVAETLRAMLAQDVPHDTWLADEDPSPATLAWCEKHGVFVSTRKGRADYHRQDVAAAHALQRRQSRLLLRPLRLWRVRFRGAARRGPRAGG